MFVDLYASCRLLNSGHTVSQRVDDFVQRHGVVVAVCAIGGFAVEGGPGHWYWLSQPLYADRVRSEIVRGLGVSGLLTYMNRSDLTLEQLGQLCVERDHDWAYQWMTLSVLISGFESEVEWSFARDTRFHLSWPLSQKRHRRAPFVATASLKNWKKFVAHAEDKNFDAPTRSVMGLAKGLLDELLPQPDLEQHFLRDTTSHARILAALKEHIEGRNVLEIGAGHGELTDLITNAEPQRVEAFEIDGRLVAEAMKTKSFDYHTKNGYLFFRVEDVRHARDLDRYAGWTMISNPPYALLPFIRELIDRLNMRNVLLMIPASEGELFPEFEVLDILNGELAFSPPSTGQHLIIRRGFDARY